MTAPEGLAYSEALGKKTLGLELWSRPEGAQLPEAPRDKGGHWGKDRAFSPRFDQSAPLPEWGPRPDA